MCVLSWGTGSSFLKKEGQGADFFCIMCPSPRGEPLALKVTHYPSWVHISTQSHGVVTVAGAGGLEPAASVSHLTRHTPLRPTWDVQYLYSPTSPKNPTVLPTRLGTQHLLCQQELQRVRKENQSSS